MGSCSLKSRLSAMETDFQPQLVDRTGQAKWLYTISQPLAEQKPETSIQRVGSGPALTTSSWVPAKYSDAPSAQGRFWNDFNELNILFKVLGATHTIQFNMETDVKTGNHDLDYVDDRPRRIVFTGGSGKAGRHCIPYLLSQGHAVLNLDLQPFEHPGVHTLKTDLTNSGQVFNALSTQFSLAEFAHPKPLPPPEAVIHFAAYARNSLVPDNETFAANTQSTYNVIEAACKLGIKKIIIASSETVYGVCFTQGESDYAFWPLDEDRYDCNPEDTYAISKLCGERVARGFARRYPGTDIYVLRIGNVVEPHEYVRDFPTYLADPGLRKRNAWSYVDARDLGQICDLAVKVDELGFQVFNATNDEITIPEGVTSEEFLRSVGGGMEGQGVEFKRAMGAREAPLSNRKVKWMLGFEEKHNWKDELRMAMQGSGQ